MGISQAEKDSAPIVRYNLRRLLAQEPFQNNRHKMADAVEIKYKTFNKYVSGARIIKCSVAEEMARKLNVSIAEFYKLPPDDYNDAKWQIPNSYQAPSYKQRYETILQLYNEVLMQNQLKDETIAQLRFRIQQLEDQQTPYMAAEPEN